MTDFVSQLSSLTGKLSTSLSGVNQQLEPFLKGQETTVP